jgi:peptidoglycan/xylan/chitin deacetylase (PgdA/CDA1 family)
MAGKFSITFDDALASVYSLALPELERLGLTGTVFVISDLIGKSYMGHPVMNEGMLRSLVAKKWEIGSHTRTHPRLPELLECQVNVELRDSKRRLENLVGTKVVSLAYPYGVFSISIKTLAARYYTVARTTSLYPPLRLNSLSPGDPMEIKSLSGYEYPVYLPFHLTENYFVKLGWPSCIRATYKYLRKRTANRSWINSIHEPPKFHQEVALKFPSLVKKWFRKLRKNQWLVLTFHNISSNERLSSYPTTRLRDFREIVKAGAESADVLNLGEVVQS